jgi:hypothetical protein
MSSYKKLTLKGLCGRCLFVWRPEPHTFPPLHTVYVYTVLYTYSRMEGGGRGKSEQRRLKEQQFTKLGRKYQHDWLSLQSINSDKHLPQSTFTGQYF